MASPQPPSVPTTTAFAIHPVMYGQQWATQDGEPVFADHDGVRITILRPDGTPLASVLQSTDAAIALAQLLIRTAGDTINTAVDDEGKPVSALQKLFMFNDAWGKH